MNPKSYGELFSDEASQKLLHAGNQFAYKLNLKFITAQLQFYNQSKFLYFYIFNGYDN